MCSYWDLNPHIKLTNVHGYGPVVIHCLTNPGVPGSIPRTFKYMYWFNPGLCGFSTGCTQDCVIVVPVEPRSVWLEYWLDPGLCGWSTGWTKDCVVGVLVGPRTVCMKYEMDPGLLKYWLDPGLHG